MDLYAGIGPNHPRVTVALDLVVNGEKLHFEQPFPLAAWDAMSPEERAVHTLHWMQGAAADMVGKFADQITVTRHEGSRR